METTKYYFEQDLYGISKTERCYYTKNDFLSKECRNCANNKGFDKEEKYIKCMMYEKEIEVVELLEIIQKVVKERNDLKDELYFLKGGL